MREVIDLSCCVDIDRRSKFCFVEYETDTAAEKAVDAENGRGFKGSNLSINSVLLCLHQFITKSCDALQVHFNSEKLLIIYRIYSRISRKINDKIMPQKLGGGDL